MTFLDNFIKSLRKGIEIVKEEPDSAWVEHKIMVVYDYINYDQPIWGSNYRLSKKLERASKAEKIELKTQYINCLINILKQIKLMQMFLETKL